MNITARIAKLRQQIDLLEQKHQRQARSVKLIAVSKNHPVEDILSAISAGQHDFAENYWQQAKVKILALSEQAITWHFIGKLQLNKAKYIANYFTWVHTVDSLQLAQKLNQYRAKTNAPLNVCIQVKLFSEETTKSGIAINELDALCAEINALPYLRLRGLMCIPKAGIKEFQQQRQQFHLLKQAFDDLKKTYPMLDTLSMGMSADFAAAIAEGATMIRLGTAIFGPRTN